MPLTNCLTKILQFLIHKPALLVKQLTRRRAEVSGIYINGSKLH